jgi:tripartite-type tricarboxylate transporter receptor subunit TctC
MTLESRGWSCAPRSSTKALAVAALAAATIALAAGPVLAADPYPAHPVKIVVPWPAGGLVDIVGRNVGEKLGAALGKPVIVENKLGAGGSIGADAVAKAAPDGHTLLLSTTALNMNAALGTKTPFDVLEDFVPIANAAFAPNILVVHPSLTAKTIGELIALLKKEPGKHTFGSAGIGSPAHFAAELFGSKAGFEAVHVPYKGAPAAMLDQIAGRIDFHFANAAIALPQIQAGKVRPLAITSSTRSPLLPDVPTLAESGVPGYVADQWIGFLAPAGTPASIVERLASEISKAIAQDDVRAALSKRGMVVDTGGTPAQFRAYIREDHQKWNDLAKTAGLKAE